jgi:CubicO group peptidase (beta-lactamase class C family)
MRGLALAFGILLTACATVPRGLSPRAEVGVAFNRDGETASFADGLADPRSGRLVTADDPVRVASVSKLVVAIGVLQLVESGKLRLDRDVSTYLGWTLRNPAFPERPITLPMLLTHTSSVREHDDNYLVPLGASLSAAMQDPREWDPAHGPGDNYFAYTNMNFPIVASVIEKVTGERFDKWMRAHVIEPMKLDACYNWPTCSDAAVARAVELDGPDGTPKKDDLHGARPACPVYTNPGDPCDLTRWRPGENGSLFAPQGGLRISMHDLARVGQMLLDQGTLDGIRILSPASVGALLTPVWLYDGHNGSRTEESSTICAYGLAAQQIPTHRQGCPDDPGTRGALLVGHAGDAYGLRSGLWIDRNRGVGIAYFVTGVPEDPPEASRFSPEETGAFRRTYALLRP